MMAELEMPVGDGSTFSVEIDERDIADDLVLASSHSHSPRSSLSFEDLLGKVEPALRAVAEWAGKNAPDQCTVELGLKVGGETGIIVAKGTAEANFVVKMTWGPSTSS